MLIAARPPYPTRGCAQKSVSGGHISADCRNLNERNYPTLFSVTGFHTAESWPKSRQRSGPSSDRHRHRIGGYVGENERRVWELRSHKLFDDLMAEGASPEMAQKIIRDFADALREDGAVLVYSQHDLN